MKIPLNDLFNYCVNNNLCTRMDNVQYEEILNGAANNKYDVCELALLLKFCSDTSKSQNDIIHDIINIYVAPTINHAHWIDIESAKNTIKCSNCGHIRELRHFSEIIKRPKYCEMCRSKMNESEESNNDIYTSE